MTTCHGTTHGPVYLVICWLISAVGSGQGPVQGSEPACPDLHSLKQLNECQLDHLFSEAQPGSLPVGTARGQVLLLPSARMPRAKIGLANAVWKGKHFEDDSTFINQWPGFQALRSRATYGTSWYDGKPCIVIDYAPGTPLFGNYHDDIREIAPGLYLARLYQRCPCPQFRGYFAFQITCSN